jgi:hypothetical protein
MEIKYPIIIDSKKIYSKEKSFSNIVIKTLNQIPGCYVYKRHAGPFRKGRADITGVINVNRFTLQPQIRVDRQSVGLHIEIESKKSLTDQSVTKKQSKWLNDFSNLGAISFAADSLKEVISKINKRINGIERYISVV